MNELVTAALVCPACGGEVTVSSRHVVINGSAVRVYCSDGCAAGILPEAEPVAKASRRPWILFALLIVVAGTLTTYKLREKQKEELAAVTTPPPPAPAPEPQLFGPAWPPDERDLLAELQRDTWIHPLAGPTRRMPVSDSRIFGAERPGDRPGECRSGHCGVDLGGEVWGEQVYVAHEGVVDRVQRGPNEQHGGLYVRVAHRGGSVFTQYFHLAAIPRWITPGVRLKAGDVVGLLGDSGVQHSTAHLHFTLSVQPSKELPEQYIDPEALLALWPLRLPVGPGQTMVSADQAPGVPRGRTRLSKSKLKKTAKAEAPSVEEAPADPAE